MITFRLILFTFQGSQVSAQIKIVEIVTIFGKGETPRHHCFKVCFHPYTYPQHTELCPQRFCILNQCLQHRFYVSCSYRHHVGQLFTGIKAKQQITVQNGILGLV